MQLKFFSQSSIRRRQKPIKGPQHFLHCSRQYIVIEDPSALERSSNSTELSQGEFKQLAIMSFTASLTQPVVSRAQGHKFQNKSRPQPHQLTSRESLFLCLKVALPMFIASSIGASIFYTPSTDCVKTLTDKKRKLIDGLLVLVKSCQFNSCSCDRNYVRSTCPGSFDPSPVAGCDQREYFEICARNN